MKKTKNNGQHASRTVLMSNKKNRRKESLFSRILFLLANALFLTVLAVSVWKIGGYLLEGVKSSSFSQSLWEEAVIMEKTSGKAEADNALQIPAAIDFDRLHEISGDAVAWIYSPDTRLNYVIAQAEDNDHYLHRLLDGSAAKGGTLFADYRCRADFSDWNTVVYGHNMKNGTMFKTLLNYQAPEYYEAHPVMYLYTPGRRQKLELIAGYTTKEDDPIYSLPASLKDRDEILDRALKASTFISDVKPGAEDRLVTLSTCSYDYDEARYVVIGRLVDE